MPNSTVIQEFLAELGFKVDQKTLGDFTKALKTNTTQAVAFGNIWSDVAESVGKNAAKMVKGVLELTQQLDQLYFASRRMQDTAQNVSAMAYVFKQQGLAPEKGQAMGEFLAEKRATYGPQAFANWANALAPGANVKPGDSPEQANAKIMHALSVGAHGTEYQQRMTHARLEAMGGPISWADLQQWDPNKDRQFWDQSIKSQKDFGANLNQTTKDAHETATSMRELDEDVRNLKIGALDPFLGLMKEGADEAVQLANGLSGVARAMEDIARAWASATAQGIPQNLIPFSIGAGAGAAGGAAGAGVDTSSIGQGGPGSRPTHPNAHARGAPKPQPPPTTHPGAPAHAAPPPQPPPSGPAPVLPGGRLPRSLRDFNPGNIMGRDAATGKMIYEHYANFAEGFGAMARQVRIDYVRHGLHTIRDLILRWNPPNAPGNNPKETQNYINRVAAAVGVNPNVQVDYTQPGVIRKLMVAMALVEAGGGNKYATLLTQGAASMPFTQNNTFNIRATDPKGTGREVVAALAHTGKTARYMRGGPAV